MSVHYRSATVRDVTDVIGGREACSDWPNAADRETLGITNASRRWPRFNRKAV